MVGSRICPSSIEILGHMLSWLKEGSGAAGLAGKNNQRPRGLPRKAVHSWNTNYDLCHSGQSR
jgi:hypothetical protein